VKWLSSFKPAATRAQRFLRRFLDKTTTVAPQHVEHYILKKSMAMYLRMHMIEDHFIDALPRGRPNKYIRQWIHSNTNKHYNCYIDLLLYFLSQELILSY
jgi:hypothetical protein